jgi:hypothetical protein
MAQKSAQRTRHDNHHEIPWVTILLQISAFILSPGSNLMDSSVRKGVLCKIQSPTAPEGHRLLRAIPKTPGA